MIVHKAKVFQSYKQFWAGYGAAVWALIFAVFHFLWAAGLYIGLPYKDSQKAFHQTWFFVYNLIVTVFCVFGILLGLALNRVLGRRLPRLLLIFTGWCATIILMLRGGAGVLQFVYHVITGRDVIEPVMFWEFWFCLGAVFFYLAIRQYKRQVE